MAITISSTANQTFQVSDPITAISLITITDNEFSPVITALNNIRIRIPAGFDMEWDATDTDALIGGVASAKVETTVSYEDLNTVLVLDVNTDFAAGDQITVSLLGFDNFGSIETVDNLELEIDNKSGQAIAEDDKTIQIDAA